MNVIDLTHAIEGFRGEKPQFLPSGQITHIEVLPDHLLLKIEMKYLDNQHVLEFKVEYDKLVEVLVAFCVDRRIPLPTGCKKAAFAVDDEVVLEISPPDEIQANRPGELTRWRDRVGI